MTGVIRDPREPGERSPQDRAAAERHFRRVLRRATRRRRLQISVSRRVHRVRVRVAYRAYRLISGLDLPKGDDDW